jgi:ABC-type glycerol-3-phosphate transport system substrate-binding protein
MKHKALMGIGVLLVLGATACASSGGAAPGKSHSPVTVTILSGQQSENGTVLQSIWGRFNASSKSVHVDLQLSNDSDSQTVLKASADVLAGDPPDAVRVTSDGLPTFIDSGKAQPLDSCLASHPALRAAIRPDVLNAFSAHGHLYAMPWYVTTPALFYNANLFKQAGLNPSDPPATWSQLAADAAKLTDKARQQYGVVTYMPETYLFDSLLLSAGGSMVNSSGTQAAFDSAAGQKVLQMQRSLVASGEMPLYSNGGFWTDSSDAFAGGKLAMILDSSSDYGQLASSVNFPVGVAPMPSLANGPAIGAASSNGFVMLTTNPAAQKATCDALVALITPQAVTQTVKSSDTVPIINGIETSQQYLGSFYAKNPGLLKVNSEKAAPWYIFPGTSDPQIENDFANAQYLALNGSETPQAALASLLQEANTALSQARG